MNLQLRDGDLPASETLQEARRFSEICNACRYCEGYCPVFPAMFQRRAFADADLGYLAHLCHNCKGCYHACQYAPPHEFQLNLPATLSELRVEDYERFAFPRAAGRLFRRNGFFVALATAALLSAVLILSALFAGDLNRVHVGPGAFYAVIPHWAMAWTATITFGWAVLAIAVGVARYWRACGGGGRPHWPEVRAALKDAATTRHLGGRAGEGCNDLDEGYAQARRHLHMATMWGFLLCLASTCTAALMDLVGWLAPYPWWTPPVVLGTVGGVGLAVGTAGLFTVKMMTDRAPEAVRRWGMDTGLLALLFLTATTGLALLFWRHTGAMGWLLAIHLGVVLALFVTMPYGKFVHAAYRLAALVRYHRESPRRA